MAKVKPRIYEKKKTDKGSAYRENLASVVIVCLLRVLTNEYQ